MVVLTLILAFALLKRVLKPMRKLSGIMLRRDPGELTPLPRVLPWSEMQPLLVAFNRYIERLRLMVARGERFSADASHQLRTPLAVLKTQVGVALASDRPQQWRESLQAMSTTLDNTVALTDRLLHLSRLKASEHRAERQLHPVNLAQVLRDACFPACRRRAVNRSISGLKARRRAGGGEPLLLAELCANLLDNALKYTPRRGVVTARLTQDQASGKACWRLKTAAPASPCRTRRWRCSRFIGWTTWAISRALAGAGAGEGHHRVSRHPPGAAELRRAGRPVGAGAFQAAALSLFFAGFDVGRRGFGFTRQRRAQPLRQNNAQQGDAAADQVVTVQLFMQEQHGDSGGKHRRRVHKDRGGVGAGRITPRIRGRER